MIGTDVIMYTYFVIGTAFLFYAYMVFIQTRVSNPIRFSLTALFLFLGFLFMNTGGKILNDYSVNFERIGIIISLIVLLIGGACTWVLFSINRKRLDNRKKQSK